jgi:hypothetical protein
MRDAVGGFDVEEIRTPCGPSIPTLGGPSYLYNCTWPRFILHSTVPSAAATRLADQLWGMLMGRELCGGAHSWHTGISVCVETVCHAHTCSVEGCLPPCELPTCVLLHLPHRGHAAHPAGVVSGHSDISWLHGAMCRTAAMFDDAAAAAHVFGCVICVNNTWAAGTWHLGWCVWVLHACPFYSLVTPLANHA